MEKGSWRSEQFHQLQFPSAESVTKSTSHFKTSGPLGRHRITKNPIHIDHEIIVRHQIWLKQMIYNCKKCSLSFLKLFIRTCLHMARAHDNIMKHSK